MPVILEDKTFKIQGTKHMNLKSRGNMVYCLAKNAIKSILSWNNKNSIAFDGMQNEAATKEITYAIISVYFISVFICAIIASADLGMGPGGPASPFVREFFSFVNV